MANRGAWERALSWTRLVVSITAAFPMLVLAYVMSYSHVATDDQIAAGLVGMAVLSVLASGVSAWRTRSGNTNGEIWFTTAGAGIVILALLGWVSAMCIAPAAMP